MFESKFMQMAVSEAKNGRDIGEIPVGCVIVKDGCVIATGINMVQKMQNPVLHAEIVAIEKACKSLGEKSLSGCSLFTTLEPCYMCIGAIINAKISRLYIGAEDKKCGAVLNGLEVVKFGNINHKPDVYSNILEYECSKLLNDFFQSIRK